MFKDPSGGRGSRVILYVYVFFVSLFGTIKYQQKLLEHINFGQASWCATKLSSRRLHGAMKHICQGFPRF